MEAGSHAAYEELNRGLKERHVQLIALGGAIGVGLFLGSASAIQIAGPSLTLTYVVAGVVLFFMMRALGELALYRPVSGSFATYAEEFVGPWAGFVTGWTYWFMWVVIGMAEITAVGVYVRYWFPAVSQWIPALIALVALYLVNLIAVGFFGEFEFWFAIIKIATIVALIIIGLMIVLFGFGELGRDASFSNLWEHGGFFPKGLSGTLLSLQIVVFAFAGIELIGVTAGEAQNPERTIPKAINKVLWRILIFYVGALLIIMSLVPWDRLSTHSSPFVLVFERVGLPEAAGIINFVVITAAMSSCNSGIFSTGRMLYTLAGRNQAPRIFGKVSSRKVPARAGTASVAAMSIGVLLNYLVPERVFTYVTSVAIVGVLWTWAMIVIAHLAYRRAVREGRLRQVFFGMPGAPWTNWLVVLFLAVVLVILGFDESTRVALYVAPVWFGIVAIGYLFIRVRRSQSSEGVQSEDEKGDGE